MYVTSHTKFQVYKTVLQSIYKGFKVLIPYSDPMFQFF